jgi:lysozyme
MKRIVVIVLGAVGLVAILAWLLSGGWHPSDSRFAIQGIDVSHHQGRIDWGELSAQDVDFAYIKSTEGGDLRDPRFVENWQSSKAAGIPRGAYHFFTLCRSGADQAANFVAVVPAATEALPPVVDLEFGGNCAARPDPAELISQLEEFLRIIERHSGKPAILYLTREFDEFYGISSSIARPLWLRRIILEPNFGGRPWTIWQVSNFRRLKGIEGRVDWNVSRQSPDELASSSHSSNEAQP